IVEVTVHRARVHHRHARGLERGLVVRLGFAAKLTGWKIGIESAEAHAKKVAAEKAAGLEGE
ncbi:hypothetical protein, partial [Bifidobacterium longum]|uniref:hypothetical protein n=1 Tax=Bifidobacterium longum TaxID=216816 RepID=UPI0012FEA8CC